MNDVTQIPAARLTETPYNHGAKKEAVLAYIEKHPYARNSEVARALNIRAGYVSIIRQRAGVTKSRGPRIVMDFREQTELYNWLKNSAPAGQTPSQFAISLLVDVMHDDLEAEGQL